MCTCPVGINGQPCKHQYFVASHFSLDLPNSAPIHSKSGRQLLALIAVGKEHIQSLEFYSSLHEQSLPESLDASSIHPDDPDLNESLIHDPDPCDCIIKDRDECSANEHNEFGKSDPDPDESSMNECAIKDADEI